MKNTILAAAAALAFTATAASAFELGSTGLQFNNDFVAVYNTDTEVLSTTLTPELRYIPMESVSVYVSTAFDLQDPVFNGVTVGAEYIPGVDGLDLTTYVKATSDSDLKFDAVTLGVEFKF